MQKPILHCYIEKDTNGSWFAICIDLNLCLNASSSSEAKTQLLEMIHAYIKEAATSDRPHFDDLIPRRAPVRFVLKYYWYWFLNHIANFKKKFDIFTERYPIALKGC